MADLKTLTDEELTSLNQKLGAEIDDRREQRRAITAELDLRHNEKKAEQILSTLPEGSIVVLAEKIRLRSTAKDVSNGESSIQ